MLQIGQGGCGRSGTIANGTAHLTAALGADIACGEDAGNVGAHLGIGLHEACGIAADLFRQPAAGGLHAHIEESSFSGDDAGLAAFHMAHGYGIHASHAAAELIHHASGHQFDILGGAHLVLIDLRATEGVASMDEVHLVHDAGKVEGYLPLSIASNKSCAQGTNNQTIVHFSFDTASKINSGFVPFKRIALLPDKRLPNQCIFAPV